LQARHQHDVKVFTVGKRLDVKRHDYGLHPTRLLSLEIVGHARFQGVLW
jgi:hypothetical protein